MLGNKVQILLVILVPLLVGSVPFVTKRVSLHNPINIDYMGWRPLKHVTNTGDDDVMQMSATHGVSSVATSGLAESQQSTAIPPDGGLDTLDNQFLTVPVAVETNADHVLSETDLNQIREHVITNWREKAVKRESFPHLSPFVTKLLPKPEIEVTKQEIREQIAIQAEDSGRERTPEEEKEETNGEYTFVKMDKNSLNANNSSTEENLFHAYFAAKDHIPPKGYIRLSKSEFKNLFQNAEILFV